MSNILVTGAAGYIGSVLCPALLAAGHRVTALDNFLYGAQQATVLAPCCADPCFDLVRGDARDPNTIRALLLNQEVIIPLAAIVGAPACTANPNGAVSTNHDAIRTLCDLASPEQLIIYPNTNSMYGAMPPWRTDPLTELDAGRPLSLYAETKWDGEVAVRSHSNHVVFRLATVFGASPRMRTDLLVNDLVLRAYRDRTLTLYEPHVRRNFVHVRDVADAFLRVIDARDMFRDGVYNLGNDAANTTKLGLAERIKHQIPDLAINTTPGADPDRRDYLVSSARLAAAGFTARYSLEDGITELLKLYRAFPVTPWGNM